MRRLNEPRFGIGNPPSVVLDMATNSTEFSALAPNAPQHLPDSTSAVYAWASNSLLPELTGIGPMFAAKRLLRMALHVRSGVSPSLLMYLHRIYFENGSGQWCSHNIKALDCVFTYHF